MKLYMKQTAVLKQEFDISNENDEILYKVKGNIGFWGRKSHIYDGKGERELAFIKQRPNTWKFDVKINDEVVATVKKKLFSFTTKIDIEPLNWTVKGKFKLFERNYTLTDGDNVNIANIKKSLSLTDAFEVDVLDEKTDILLIISIVMAIDSILDQK